jgi:hypothetical protein
MHQIVDRFHQATAVIDDRIDVWIAVFPTLFAAALLPTAITTMPTMSTAATMTTFV